MGLSAELALAVAKKYTDKSLEGGGAVRGKNCTVEKPIGEIPGGHRVKFLWELDDGTEDSTTMDVMDGVDGSDGADGADGVGVPSGGTTGQILAKSSNTDYATEWIDAPSGGSTGAFVTPEMFGAVGNGTTDDTAAFTAAFAACNHVICTPNKTYMFDGIVDASDLEMGELNLNNSTFKNFHIKIYMASDGYKAKGDNPTKRFKIHNGILGMTGYVPDNWQTPAIQSGTHLWLDKLRFSNTPYVAALTNNYRDRMIFSNLDFTAYDADWVREGVSTWTLDAINLITGNGTFSKIDETVINNTGSTGNKFAGDCWEINHVDEFKSAKFTNYSFMHFYKQHTVQINNCVQSRFMVGADTHAKFNSCHWENINAYPKFERLKNGVITAAPSNSYMEFDNCYFNNNYTIETDKKEANYFNCYFRATDRAEDATIPYGTTLNDHDYYDMNCSMRDCFMGSYRVTIDDYRKAKAQPKRTRGARNNHSDESTLAASISSEKTIGEGDYTYPQTGTYNYVGFAFTNGAEIAHERYAWTRTVSVAGGAQDASSLMTKINGGWGFEIYRTLPDSTIQRVRYYDAPVEDALAPAVSKGFNLIERGNYFIVKKTVYHTSGNTPSTQESYPLPWVTVSAIPSYTVNNKVYEKNGVLVTTDDSAITDLPDWYSQVPDQFSV